MESARVIMLGLLDEYTINERMLRFIQDPPMPNNVLTRDFEKGLLTYEEPNSNNEYEIASFDYYLLRQIKQVIPVVETEIATMLVGEGLSRVKANNNLSNFINSLRARHFSLKHRNIVLTQSLILVHSLIEQLETYLIPEHKDANKRIKNQGFAITYYRVKQPRELLNELFDHLVSEHAIDAKSRETFIAFFTQTWNGIDKIKWLSKPRFFVQLCSALFNKIDDEFVLVGRKTDYTKLLECFIVKDDDGMPHTRLSLEKYNSNPKQGSFYDSLVNVINDHLRE